ncbi:MAG: glutamine--fructose-6-phosphate transaminase (isomerizing) [Patescibacteria group bacterium]
MCGIFGYVGKTTNVGQMVLSGLKTLEYRGYDSWGIATKGKSQKAKGKSLILIEKHIGKIGNARVSFPKSNIGIGHTRWATHGGVTVKNAHPHLDCEGKIAVLHNGIIENYEEIKEELIKKGHKFVSETDTEIFPHLLEELYKTNDFETSFRLAFNKINGLNAIVAINSKTSEIAAAKTGSPLVIGISEDGFYISSDSLGIVPYTRKLLFLKDNEMVILGKTLKLRNLPEGREKRPEIETVDWKIEEVSMGKFRHFMHKEIYDQPKVIRGIVQREDEIRSLSNIIKEAFGTFFIGAGTAYYACLAGSYFFSKIARRHVNTIVASEFNYLEDFLTDKSLVIALSQSGETIDVVEPIQRAVMKGAKIAAVTNVLGSTIYRISDFKMLLNAGPEKAVASTKAFLAKLAVLLMTSYDLANKQKEGKEILLKTAGEVERILKNEGELSKIVNRIKDSLDIYIIGRGPSFPSALEGALKIKEVSYVHAEGLSGGELKHGSIALIEKGTPVFVFAPNDETYGAIMSNASEIKARGGLIIGVSFKESPLFDHFIEVKDVGEGSILAQIVPLQLFAYFLGVIKGYDPDKPRNLAKSVTVK